MIDLESTIYDQVITELLARDDLPEFSHSSEYVRMPASFPHLTFMEMDNSTEKSTRDSGSGENHVVLTYETNTYSNALVGKKQQCRKLADAMDEILLGMNFERISLKPVENVLDASVYRMVGRYRVVADAEGRLYSRR